MSFLEALLERPAWYADAACRGSSTAGFFPGRGATDATPRDDLGHVLGSEAEAKRICETCPVADACLAHALATPELHGIWGGLSERQRRPLRRRWLAEEAAARVLDECVDCA